MSNAKHTPGPWAVQYGLHADPEQYTPGIDGGNGETIILFGIKPSGDECGIRGSTVDEQEANARLIAAAPELLEALIEARGWVSEYAGQLHGYTICDEAHRSHRRICSAIAKATGEQA